jgi:hypothetical protein
VVTIGVLGRPCAAEPPAPPASPPAAPAAPAANAPRPLTEKETAEAIPLLRNYLVHDHPERTSHRLELRKWIEAKRTAGVDPLAHVPSLLDAIYRARPFGAPFDRRSLREGRFEVDAVNRITSIVKGDQRFSYSIPSKYPSDPRKAGAVPPYPTILSLHELVDYEEGPRVKEFPGLETIKRRYARQGPLKAVTEEWLVFAPVSTKARFDGDFNRRIVGPYKQFWERFHVDFDRVVLDGGEDALHVAASIPIFFSGVIVRAAPRGALDPKLAVNLAHLPIYVVGGDDAPAAKWLKAAGITPTVGPAEGLVEWLRAAREKPRVPLTQFKWRVQDPESQILAHWINVNQAEKDSDLDVKADREKNELHVKGKGVGEIQVFLDDRILDLNRPVKLVLNGKERPPETLKRNLDEMFEGDRLSIRSSGFYGWLYPVTIKGVTIPQPEAPTTPAAGTDAATAPAPPPDDGGGEDLAGVLFRKAGDAEKTGDLKKAVELLRKAIAVGESSVKAKAEEKLKELEAKVPPPAPAPAPQPDAVAK